MDRLDFNKKIYTKKIEIASLRPGDILAHNLYFDNGLLIAKAGIALTDETLAFFSHIKSKIVTLDLSKVYDQSIIKSRLLFSKAQTGDIPEEKEILEMLEPFIKEVDRETNILRLLYQMKSQDAYTFQHTINIGVLAYCIGKWAGYTDDSLIDIALAGTMHDIGKSLIPMEILNKPDKLTAEEFDIIKRHSQLGYELLSRQSSHKDSTKKTALQHHERSNGLGYPLGLAAHEIHPYAKIVAVADVYHAMTSKRVYKDKINPFVVLDHLQKNIDSLDTKLVLVFIDNLLSSLMSTQVVLNNGRTADVLYIDKYNIRYPLIRLAENGEIVDLKDSDLTIVDIVI